MENKIILNKIINEAPPRFDRQFLQWVYHIGDTLFINFENLGHPADAMQVQRYAQIINQRIPEEIQVYYEHANPFGRLQKGWALWYERERNYRSIWMHTLLRSQEQSKVEKTPSAFLPLWPVECLDRSSDRVGFVWMDKIVLIEINPQSGRGKPLAIGLRNYFLQEIVVEILAEKESEPVDFDRLRQHPIVSQVSGWPASPPFPEHISFTVTESNIAC